MRALLLHEKGLWKEMKVEEIATPEPGKGEILVEVKAAGLNPVDYKTGTNGYPGWSFPHVLGLDVAGVVAKTGEGVTHVKTGDRVVYLNNMMRRGGFAEYAVTDGHLVSVIPDGVSFEEAASLPVAAYTAYQALFHKMRIQSGRSILVHAGAGGVGGYAIQLAKDAGLTVYTTASEKNHEYVRSLGADAAIDYRSEDFAERVLELTDGVGVDYVLDTVGRENATASLKALAFNGHIAFIAGQPEMNGSISFGHPVSFHHVALGSVYQSSHEGEKVALVEMGDALLALMSEGRVKALVEQVVALEEVPGKLEEISERGVKGKIVAKIGE